MLFWISAFQIVGPGRAYLESMYIGMIMKYLRWWSPFDEYVIYWPAATLSDAQLRFKENVLPRGSPYVPEKAEDAPGSVGGMVLLTPERTCGTVCK